MSPKPADFKLSILELYNEEMSSRIEAIYVEITQNTESFKALYYKEVLKTL